jgi:hypothetical protein
MAPHLKGDIPRVEDFEFFSTAMGLALLVDDDSRMRAADAAQPAERFYWTNAAVRDTVTWAKTAVANRAIGK